MSKSATDGEKATVRIADTYYDPATAQFISRDPMVMQTRSAYGYVGGNPLNGRDPSGLEDREVQCYDSSGHPDGQMVQDWEHGQYSSGESCDTANVQGGVTWGGGGIEGMNPESNQSFDNPGLTSYDKYEAESTHLLLDACQSLLFSVLRVPRYIRFGISLFEHGIHRWRTHGW